MHPYERSPNGSTDFFANTFGRFRQRFWDGVEQFGPEGQSRLKGAGYLALAALEVIPVVGQLIVSPADRFVSHLVRNWKIRQHKRGQVHTIHSTAISHMGGSPPTKSFSGDLTVKRAGETSVMRKKNQGDTSVEHEDTTYTLRTTCIHDLRRGLTVNGRSLSGSEKISDAVLAAAFVAEVKKKDPYITKEQVELLFISANQTAYQTALDQVLQQLPGDSLAPIALDPGHFGIDIQHIAGKWMVVGHKNYVIADTIQTIDNPETGLPTPKPVAYVTVHFELDPFNTDPNSQDYRAKCTVIPITEAPEKEPVGKRKPTVLQTDLCYPSSFTDSGVPRDFLNVGLSRFEVNGRPCVGETELAKGREAIEESRRQLSIQRLLAQLHQLGLSDPQIQDIMALAQPLTFLAGQKNILATRLNQEGLLLSTQNLDSPGLRVEVFTGTPPKVAISHDFHVYPRGTNIYSSLGEGTLRLELDLSTHRSLLTWDGPMKQL